jgi:hypothetical protein
MEETNANDRHPKRLAVEMKYNVVSIYIKEYAEMVHWKYCPMVKKMETIWIAKEHIRRGRGDRHKFVNLH